MDDLSVVAAILFTVVGQLMIYPILKLLHTPEEIISLSYAYLRILYAGIPLTVAYNLFAAVLRALGNSKAPLKAMTISSLCNVVLDILFVFVFGLGIEGAAWGTVIAQLFAAVFCLFQLKKIDILRFEKEEYRVDKQICGEQLKLGIPMGLQSAITAVGGLVVQSVINGFGVIFIAGYTAANKLYGLLEIAASSYGYAMSSYAGQNMGAGNKTRIKKGLFAANGIGVVTALFMSAVMLFTGKWILACFIAGDAVMVQAAIQIGYRFLIILSIFFPLLYILYITRACIQGMGNTVLPMISSIAQLIMRVGCALILPFFIGESGVFFGEVFAWLGADIILGLWVFHHFKKQ